ncbi:MAG: hypothetical protein IJO87_05575 [Eggerthellaceae bacterium]|nr:hypothetical protein [Eggerthellaceae bacterium]
MRAEYDFENSMANPYVRADAGADRPDDMRSITITLPSSMVERIDRVTDDRSELIKNAVAAWL